MQYHNMDWTYITYSELWYRDLSHDMALEFETEQQLFLTSIKSMGRTDPVEGFGDP